MTLHVVYKLFPRPYMPHGMKRTGEDEGDKLFLTFLLIYGNYKLKLLKTK